MLALLTVRGATVALNFVSMLGIAALMGSADYGVFVFAWALAVLGSALISMGLPVWLLKELALSRVEGPLAFNRSICMAFGPIGVVAAVFAGAVGIAGLEIAGLGGSLVLPTFALATLIHILACLSSILHALGYLNVSMALRDAAPQGGALLIALVLASTEGLTPGALLSGTAVLLALLGGGCTVFALRAAYRSGLIARKGRSGHFNWAYWGGTVSGSAWSQIDLLIGGLLLSSADLGVYNVLRRCCNLVTLPLSVSTWLTVGDFARAFGQRDMPALLGLIRRALITALLPGAVLVLGILSIAMTGIPVFDLPDGLAPVWALLLMQALIVLFFAPSVTMANTGGLERSVMTGRLAGMLAYISVVLPLAGLFSPLIANACAMLVGTLVLYLWIWGQLRQRWGLDASALQLVGRG